MYIAVCGVLAKEKVTIFGSLCNGHLIATETVTKAPFY